MARVVEFWTDEQKNEVVKLWNDGWTSGALGRHFGKTRNAIIGILSRLRSRLGEDKVPARPCGAKTKHRRPGANRPLRDRRKGPKATRNLERRLAKAETIEDALEIERAPLPATTGPTEHSKPCTILEVEDHQCKWPVSGEGADMLCCGADAYNGHSYCAEHCRVAFNDV